MTTLTPSLLLKVNNRGFEEMLEADASVREALEAEMARRLERIDTRGTVHDVVHALVTRWPDGRMHPLPRPTHSGSPETPEPRRTMDAITLLKNDHAKVKKLLAELESHDRTRRQDAFGALRDDQG